MDDSLYMAAMAVQSGVHTLAATSHANTGGFFKEYSDGRIYAKVRSVSEKHWMK